MRNMRVELEACGEYLSHLGALEEANAIAEILRKIGAELPESSPFRWRALLDAIRQELDAEPIDATFVFERLLQLHAMMPSIHSRALLDSPLFLHLLVKRFASAFEGLDAELFKLESEELCHAEGVFETCQLIGKQSDANEAASALKKFLASFERIFEQEEPKECWEAFYDEYCLNALPFRRDMKRALEAIEAATLGPTKLELAFRTRAAEPQRPKKKISRALLEKRFGGTRREWHDMCQIVSLPGVDLGASQRQEQERPDEPTADNGHADGEAPRRAAVAQDLVLSTPSSPSRDAAESVHSDLSEPPSEVESPAPSRPPRPMAVARATRVESRRLVPRRVRNETSRESDNASESGFVGRVTTRRKRVRWSAEEVAALLEGYRLYESYSNVWVLIKNKFPVVLQNRSNVDLKDKYRNLLRYGRVPPASGDAGATHNDDDTADVQSDVQ